MAMLSGSVMGLFYIYIHIFISGLREQGASSVHSCYSRLLLLFFLSPSPFPPPTSSPSALLPPTPSLLWLALLALPDARRRRIHTLSRPSSSRCAVCPLPAPCGAVVGRYGASSNVNAVGLSVRKS
jgi:hypothetical protein